MTNSHCLAITAFAFISHFNAAEARADGVRDAVEAGNREFIKAFLRGDSTAIVRLYTEDAQVIAPGSPVANGRAAIAALWQKSIDSGTKDVALETAEVESAGGLAYEAGNVRLVAKDGAVTQARYVVVWKQVGDRWMLHRDIWNSE
jgi:ketosteroid isomerase-like protein